MLWVFAILTLLSHSGPVEAKQAWEVCLDQAEFDYNLDSFTEGTSTAKKAGCLMELGSSFGRGERFSIDLCDTAIHLIHFASLETKIPERVNAPAGACSSPTFGADYEENAKEIADYSRLRRRAIEIFGKLKSAYGVNADKVDLTDPKSFSPTVSDGKVACGQYLLKTYLVNCEAFEPKKGGASAETDAAKQGPLTPGIYPQTILSPAKK